MNDVAEANETLAQLEAKRRAALAGLANAEDRRSALSYAAMTGSAAAKKELASANADRASQEGLIADLGIAIRQAGERVAGAEKAAAEEARRNRVERVRALGVEVRALGVAAAEHKAALVGTLDLMRLKMNEVADLGGPVSKAMVSVNSTCLLDTIIFELNPKRSPPVAPDRRRDPAQLAEAWGKACELFANRQLRAAAPPDPPGAQGSPPAVTDPPATEGAREPVMRHGDDASEAASEEAA